MARAPADHHQPDEDRKAMDRLPALLREIAEATDYATAVKVARARGGRRAYIPTRPKEDHWLVEAVGFEAARKIGEALCPACGGLEFEIPVGTHDTTANTASQVERLTLSGLSKRATAEAMGLHHRTVQKYRSRLRAEGRIPALGDAMSSAPKPGRKATKGGHDA
jgi:hypothetical protein